MLCITLASQTDFAGWRAAARTLRVAGTPPEAIRWSVTGAGMLAMEAPIAAPNAPTAPEPAVTAPRRFLQLASEVICHRSAQRFDLLYRLFWRLERERGLMGLVTDRDVAAASAMAKAVSRASHKMKAFVRFRELPGPEAEPETFVAWFEPPHYVVERTAPFFRDRFANQRFSILTPDRCCHWDGERLAFTDGVERPQLADDALESAWLTYYRSIFNPARLKVSAMQSEMPKRYWRNLPEAGLIAGLVAEAETRTRSMVDSEPTRPARRLPAATAGLPAAIVADGAGVTDLGEARAALRSCRRCELWRDATQAVAGEGPIHAPLMLVGEQPGDIEDLEGRPFVGPAGRLLDQALAAAGVDRAQAYVTNAVKHFKHEARGKRRLHKTPDAGEVRACRWWLDQERDLVRPKLIVALGATAALAVFGRPMPVMKSRGRLMSLDGDAQGLVTVHPSWLLRLPDADAKAAGWRGFVDDLIVAREVVAGA